MAKQKYLDRSGLRQVLGKVGMRLDGLESLPRFCFRSPGTWTMESSTLVEPECVLWYPKRKRFLGLHSVDGETIAYERWPGWERWTNPETGKPWKGRLYAGIGYGGDEGLWTFADGSDRPKAVWRRGAPVMATLPMAGGAKRGLIPIGAQPGMAYRNRAGAVKLRMRNGLREADLGGLYARGMAPSADGNEMLPLMLPLRKCGIRLFGVDREGKEHEESVEWQGESSVLLLPDRPYERWTIRIDALEEGNLIGVRRGAGGKTVIASWDGPLDDSAPVPPGVADVQVAPTESDTVFEIIGADQVQAWRLGRKYGWRKRGGGEMSKHSGKKCRAFKVSRRQRTVFVRVRNICGGRKSEWTCLRLHRRDSGSAFTAHLAR